MLILLHDTAVYWRMLPYASKYGLRLIAISLRDYRGSTPYSAEEDAELDNPTPEVQVATVRKFGREVSDFLVYVCENLRISPIVMDERGEPTAGLVVLAWSMGSMSITAILGDPDSLEERERGVLELYLRKAVLYGEQNEIQN